MRYFKVFIIAVCLAVPQTIIAAKPDPIKYRQGVFKIMGWHFGSMFAMVKGKKPYDKESFARSAEIVDFMGTLVLEGFPPGSETGETRAKAEIWLDLEDFKNKLAKMQQETKALVKVASTGDLDLAKDQLGETGEACKACHKSYRSKKK